MAHAWSRRRTTPQAGHRAVMLQVHVAAQAEACAAMGWQAGGSSHRASRRTMSTSSKQPAWGTPLGTRRVLVSVVVHRAGRARWGVGCCEAWGSAAPRCWPAHRWVRRRARAAPGFATLGRERCPGRNDREQLQRPGADEDCALLAAPRACNPRRWSAQGVAESAHAPHPPAPAAAAAEAAASTSFWSAAAPTCSHRECCTACELQQQSQRRDACAGQQQRDALLISPSLAQQQQQLCGAV